MCANLIAAQLLFYQHLWAQIAPGVNFINILRTAFTLVGPKSVKRYWRLDWVLTLWGTTGVKAVRRTLMKSSPGVNFINVLRTNFLYERWFCSFFYVHVTREKLPKQCLYEKFVRKMNWLLLSMSSTFYVPIFCMKELFSQNVTREKLREALLYKKRE